MDFDYRFRVRLERLLERVLHEVNAAHPLSAQERVAHVRQLGRLLHAVVAMEHELAGAPPTWMAARSDVSKCVGLLAERINAVSLLCAQGSHRREAKW
jgi:hypothetical protein